MNNLQQLIQNFPNTKVEITGSDLLEFGNKLIQDTKDQIQLNFEQIDKPDLGGKELAKEVTGYAYPTIYQLVGSNKIPHFKKGGRLYFSRRELEAWIKEGRQ